MTTEPIYCLIVEDDACVADFLRSAISQPNVHSISATNGKEALEALASGKSVDIIVTDLNMPQMGGEELIKWVRAISPRTLIIVLTGYGSVPSAVSLAKQGVFEYLTKPIELDDLTNALERAIEQVLRLRQGNIASDIAEVWHIGQLIGKCLTPDRLLIDVLEVAMKITKGQGATLFLHLESDQWKETVQKNFNSEKASPILAKVYPNLGKWTGLGQEEIGGNLLLVLEGNEGEKFLAAPFVDEKAVVGILLVLLQGKEVEMHLPGLLAVFCSQMYPIVNMVIRITKLLHAHEEAIRVHADLEKLHEQLKQSAKLACIGELAASIAHDINTPLTCIIGFIRLYLRFLEKPDTSVQELVSIKHYLEKANSEAERCQEIIKNLLLFSRKESKRFLPFSIADLIEKVYALLEKQFAQNNIRFSTDIPSSVAPIMGNANQIQQVVMNMLINAKNAMPNGGSIHVRAQSMQDKIRVEIIDTGKGISKENMGKIFEPFYTTDTGGKGTGLGLSISKKIIQEHAGEILVESEVGKGSTFTLLLPKA
jgi:signal transduction histidine kinase/CheY-like chemotaxis protein